MSVWMRRFVFVRAGTAPSVRAGLNLADLRRTLGRDAADRGVQTLVFTVTVGDPASPSNGARAQSAIALEEIRGSLSPGLATALEVARGLWGVSQAEKAGQPDLFAGADADESESWVNEPLAGVASQAMADELAVAANALPPWLEAIVCGGYGFLLPLGLRRRFFQSCSFGVNRSIAWLQTQAAAAAAGASGGQPSGGRLLRRDVVQVSRDHLLEHAQQIMLAYTTPTSLASVLEFRFQGERGLGAGVTASFYSAVAAAMHARGALGKLPLWVDSDSLAPVGEPITHPNGLFPMPLGRGHPRRGAVLAQFKFLGRLAARCLIDSQVLPLPLSLDFMRLVLAVSGGGAADDAPPPSATAVTAVTAEAAALAPRDLPRVYAEPGAVLLRLSRALHTTSTPETSTLETSTVADAATAAAQLDGMPLSDWLEAACLSMVDPLSGERLACAAGPGEAPAVTPANVHHFVGELLLKWLGYGVVPQAQAFVAGCAEAFPARKLRAFSAAELRDQLCGQEPLDWPLEYLEAVVSPGAGYTRNSEPFRALLHCLSDMDLPTKRRFLLFVLGCPRLPPGGLGGLTPPLEVSRRQQGGFASSFASEEQVNRDLPFARTCTHTLHLPPYSNQATLLEKLIYAMDNSRDIIDRD
ncbi:hypothetical protein JKP88DRAFT_294683 [Tribonema minus]|uniref:HECT domain-containing protein n=1 Tax=Tribonema minus TaxID=303371 RepID=A0A836CNJ7_9STRA|nr:hypothetical protein JKP88DRAFT_294683 [Tribonema minus]